MSDPTRVRITGDLYHPRVPEGSIRVTRPTKWGNPYKVTRQQSAADVVARFADDLHGGRLRISVADVQRNLSGFDLACWCPLDPPCHADVLLAAANGEHE